jgi:hypothetical protein
MLASRLILFLVLAGGLGLNMAATAQQSPPPSSGDARSMPAPRSWSSLNPAQQQMLAPLQKDWDTLSPRRQARMAERAARWALLPPDKRENIRQRVAQWQAMTPAQREQARANMRKFHELSPQQREQLHAAFARFQQLSPQKRDELLQQWQGLNHEQRQQWIEHLGPNGVVPPPPDRGPPGAPSPGDDDGF